ILRQLFTDLRADESHAELVLPPPGPFAGKPRALLVQLYGKPRHVTSRDRPEEPLGDSSKAWLIENGLLYDRSEKLDPAGRDLLVSTDNDSLGQACVKRLLGRGYDAEIEAYCRRRLPRLEEERDKNALREVLGKLGWTRLHVAVERTYHDGIRELLRERTPV